MITSGYCQIDECEVEELHHAHAWVARAVPKRKTKAKRKLQPWIKRDPEGLTESVARAVSRSYPTYFGAIVMHVHDDYGPCTTRTVNRHLHKLISDGRLVRIPLGDRQNNFAYLQASSRLLADTESVKTYVLDEIYTRFKADERRQMRL